MYYSGLTGTRRVTFCSPVELMVPYGFGTVSFSASTLRRIAR